MSEYLTAVFAACSVSALCGFVFFSKRQEKFAAAALGIILISAVLSPILSICRAIGEGNYFETAESGNDDFSEVLEESFSEAVVTAVAEKFSLSEKDISAEAFGFDKNNMSAEKVVISLRGAASYADIVSIRYFVEENNLGKCEVLISFE